MAERFKPAARKGCYAAQVVSEVQMLSMRSQWTLISTFDF